jgi:hypothetical protein
MKMSKPWANFLNEWTEDNYIPWTDSCPWCKKATPIAWNGYDIKKDELEVELNIWSCVECDAVLNMDEDDPKADVKWLSEDEAIELGLKPVTEEEPCPD